MTTRPVFLPGTSPHGQRSLVSCQSGSESDMAELGHVRHTTHTAPRKSSKSVSHRPNWSHVPSAELVVAFMRLEPTDSQSRSRTTLETSQQVPSCERAAAQSLEKGWFLKHMLHLLSPEGEDCQDRQNHNVLVKLESVPVRTLAS